MFEDNGKMAEKANEINTAIDEASEAAKELPDQDMPVEGAILGCNFCGKKQKEVKQLIAGPNVYICNECVVLCQDVLMEEGAGLSGGEGVGFYQVRDSFQASLMTSIYHFLKEDYEDKDYLARVLKAYFSHQKKPPRKPSEEVNEIRTALGKAGRYLEGIDTEADKEKIVEDIKGCLKRLGAHLPKHDFKEELL